MPPLADTGFVSVDGLSLEYRMVGPRPDQGPTLVLLHEGLGSVSTWNTFPDKLAAATGCGVFAYARAGYGRSSLVTLPRPLDYMQRDAVQIVPKLLDTIGFRRGLLVGHSDGASIATHYLGSVQDHRVRGLVLMAPHFFVEPETIAEIEAARRAYADTDLRARLARHHADVDVAFRGWNDAWLDPGFRAFDITEALGYIRVPILILHGADDRYGTVKQIRVAETECYCPVESLVLAGCGHAPHREKPAETLAAIAAFTDRILRVRGEANGAGAA